MKRVKEEKQRLGGAEDFVPVNLFHGETDIVSLRSTLIFGMKGMAAYAWHAHVLGKDSPEVSNWFYKGLRAAGEEHSIDGWLSLILEFGQINLKCMALLDEANTSTFGHPVPARVSLKVAKGPFIVVTGHDLLDLKELLELTKGKGINIYTHGEMLPAHAYPELKKYSHLKGNYGTAWQNQQKEFHNLPAPVLFTTNCIMMPRDSYINNIFTTSVVGYPGVTHIQEKNGKKDFSPLIKKAIELGGWAEDKQFTGINGGTELTTGFARNTVMGVADKVISAVKSGAIKHIFLVGGCDGAKPGRNYYTEFVKNTPADTVVLTLACGKYRFNDLNIGQIGGLPRLLDMGQCNDAYSAIQVAIALAGAFKCGVNELPLTLVLSWYEQKAVCILLTLLSLGIQNMYLGPTLPAFISPNVLKVLVDKFNIKPISTPEKDMKAALTK
jgi:hydroxylamine reductase